MANILGLDVGTKCIGVAAADTSVPIAMPIAAIEVDGNEIMTIQKLIEQRSIATIVIGYPRNQSGEATEQTAYSEQFAERLRGTQEIVFQDESLTSVMAESQLKASGKPYQKGDIDALAAALILQDYLEIHYAAR